MESGKFRFFSHKCVPPRDYIMGYESWSPEGSRKKAKAITYYMPVLCPGLMSRYVIFTKYTPGN